MATRNAAEQGTHDAMVRIRAGKYSGIVYTNPNGQQNYSVGGVYPDVVVPALRVIDEVETSSSVTESERTQWQTYARLGHTFRLVVPAEKLDDARRLISGIAGVILVFYGSRNGTITFSDM